MLQTTATGLNQQILTGTEQIQPATAIDGTGTAHKLPTPFTVTPLGFVAAAGDLLQVQVINTTAGALAVTGVIDVNPA